MGSSGNVDMVTVKVTHAGQTKRSTFKRSDLTYESLSEWIMSAFALPVSMLHAPQAEATCGAQALAGAGQCSAARLVYRDPEGDAVSISSNAELIEALNLKQEDTPLALQLTFPRMRERWQRMAMAMNGTPDAGVWNDQPSAVPSATTETGLGAGQTAPSSAAEASTETGASPAQPEADKSAGSASDEFANISDEQLERRRAKLAARLAQLDARRNGHVHGEATGHGPHAHHGPHHGPHPGPHQGRGFGPHHHGGAGHWRQQQAGGAYAPEWHGAHPWGAHWAHPWAFAPPMMAPPPFFVAPQPAANAAAPQPAAATAAATAAAEEPLFGLFGQRRKECDEVRALRLYNIALALAVLAVIFSFTTFGRVLVPVFAAVSACVTFSLRRRHCKAMKWRKRVALQKAAQAPATQPIQVAPTAAPASASASASSVTVVSPPAAPSWLHGPRRCRRDMANHAPADSSSPAPAAAHGPQAHF